MGPEARLEVLTEATTAFAEATTDPQRLLETIARRTSEVLDAFCCIFLVSEDGATLVPTVSFAPNPDVLALFQRVLARAPIAVNSPMRAAAVLHTGLPLVTPVLPIEPFRAVLDADLMARLEGQQPAGALHCPLRVHGTSIGTLAVIRYGAAAAAFDDADRDLAQSLANHAALAITNARLFDGARRMAERLTALTRTTHELAESVQNPGQLLTVAAERATGLLGDMCAIRLVDASGTVLETPVAHHPDPEMRAAILAGLSAPQKVGEGITGRVVSTGEALRLPNLAMLAHLIPPEYQPFIDRLGVFSMLFVPMKARGRVVGVMVLGRRAESGAYTEADLQLAQELGTHAGYAIANARLYEEAQRELTERRKAEEARIAGEAAVEAMRRERDAEARSRGLVEASNRMKSEFLANMSHELRTPLNAIIGFTTLLHAGKAGPVNATQVEYLYDVLDSGRHLLQLINDVLDLAKVESGRLEIGCEPISPAAISVEVCDTLRGLAAEKKIHLTAEVDPALGIVHSDARLLKQVLYNYVSNALKFTPDHGRVRLRIRPEDPTSFRIDVEDTGIGIRAEDLGKLFVAFTQLDAGHGKKYAGTGLGLALTKRLVEAQGGRVGATSDPGRGSVFSAVLPRQSLEERHRPR